MTTPDEKLILHRTHLAWRPETRAKRIRDFVAMLGRGATIYPQAGAQAR